MGSKGYLGVQTRSAREGQAHLGGSADPKWQPSFKHWVAGPTTIKLRLVTEGRCNTSLYPISVRLMPSATSPFILVQLVIRISPLIRTQTLFGSYFAKCEYNLVLHWEANAHLSPLSCVTRTSALNPSHGFMLLLLIVALKLGTYTCLVRACIYPVLESLRRVLYFRT